MFGLSVRTMLVVLAAAAPISVAPGGGACAVAAGVHEDGTETPTGLPQTIALAETGSLHGTDWARIAWPWTVKAGGTG